MIQTLSRITQEESELLKGGLLERGRYTDAQDFIVDSGRFMRQGELLSLRPHTRFADFPSHSHNYIEMVYMVSGSTTHLINGKNSLSLRQNELLILNQQATHAVKRAGQNDVAINFLLLPPFFDTDFERLGQGTPLAPFVAEVVRGNPSGAGYLHFSAADLPPVQNLIENMAWGILNNQPNNGPISQTSMKLAFFYLLGGAGQLPKTPERRKPHSLVVKALREIEQNYKSANVSAIASQCNASLSYISRMVKQATGKSFKELLQEKRLTEAARMLVQTELSVSKIIEAVGYQNTSYFYNIFKQRYGRSPSEYRACSEDNAE